MFNIEQVDGDTAQFDSYDIKQNRVTDIKAVDDYISNLKANINHDGGSRAFYRPSTDSIHMPTKDSFFDTKNKKNVSRLCSCEYRK